MAVAYGGEIQMKNSFNLSRRIFGSCQYKICKPRLLSSAPSESPDVVESV
jgi:hypothetical protein